MKYELLRISTILRYPKKRRPGYDRTIREKVKYLKEIDYTVYKSVDNQELQSTYIQILYDKLPYSISSHRFHELAHHIGTYVGVKISCIRYLEPGTAKIIKTYQIVGIKPLVIYAYLLLRWAYYSIKYGLTSKNKVEVVNYLISEFSQRLEKKRINRIREISIEWANKELFHQLQRSSTKYYITPKWMRIIYLKSITLKPGKFKHLHIIC